MFHADGVERASLRELLGRRRAAGHE